MIHGTAPPLWISQLLSGPVVDSGLVSPLQLLCIPVMTKQTLRKNTMYIIMTALWHNLFYYKHIDLNCTFKMKNVIITTKVPWI